MGFVVGTMPKSMASRGGGGGSPKNMVCKGRVTQKIILPLSLIVAASVIM